jgi:chromate transporter
LIVHEADTPPVRPASPWELFLAFTSIALQGFGGVLAVSERVLCEQRRWLTQKEFVEVLAIAQTLPGPNICNVAVIVGNQFLGWRGSGAALAGMITIPLGIVLSLTVFYARFSTLPAIGGAVRGMGVVSVGMILGAAIKLGGTLRSNVLGGLTCAGAAGAAFVAVALLRWPLILVLGGLGLICSLVAARRMMRPPLADKPPARDGENRE